MNSSIINSQLYGLYHIFYLSKYYEFIDTWIHYCKNRNPPFLQIFHHIGAIITMALNVKFKLNAAWIFVIFNSFIHFIMYLYYAIATIGFKIPLKIDFYISFKFRF